MFAISSSVTCLTTFPGDPRTSELEGIILPSVTKLPAPMIQLSPIIALFNIIAPIPIKQLLPTVHPWTIALCPTTVYSPTLVGMSFSVCTEALS